MQALILAAGLGRRLGSMTAETPKALIEVGERPLIDYALAFARAAGAGRVAVVGGFGHRDLAARVSEVDPEADLRENKQFRRGNLLTFDAGKDALEAGQGYLVMNTDHIYRPSIAGLVAEVAASAEEVTAFCDFDRDLGPDDMKVALDDRGRVAAMDKKLERWNAGYVGMTWVPGARATDHRAAAAEVRAEQGDDVHVERVLVQLGARGNPPAIADISGHGWLEIDEPPERDRAESVLARERWWRTNA